MLDKTDECQHIPVWGMNVPYLPASLPEELTHFQSCTTMILHSRPSSNESMQEKAGTSPSCLKVMNDINIMLLLCQAVREVQDINSAPLKGKIPLRNSFINNVIEQTGNDNFKAEQ